VRARRLHLTFTAPKVGKCCRELDAWVSWWWAYRQPPELYEDAWLSLLEPEMFENCSSATRGGHKGTFATCWWWRDRATRAAPPPWLGWARARRRGAGDGGVGRQRHSGDRVARPELMTAPIEELDHLVEGKDSNCDGAGLGRGPEIEAMVTRVVADSSSRWCWMPMPWVGRPWLPHIRVMTPHPGEMARLTGKPR